MERDERVKLLPLGVYVVTHELVHIVRFCKFLQRFDAEPLERQQEEMRVHEITQRALGSLRLPHLDYVLEVYRDYQFMEKLKDHSVAAPTWQVTRGDYINFGRSINQVILFVGGELQCLFMNMSA